MYAPQPSFQGTPLLIRVKELTFSILLFSAAAAASLGEIEAVPLGGGGDGGPFDGDREYDL